MLIHMFMHVSNITSQHTSLHTKRTEKGEDIMAFSACYTVLHHRQQGHSSHVVLFSKCSSHVCPSINKYMYFVRNYHSVCIHVCVPTTEDSNPLVSSLLHYCNHYHIFTFACTLNCPVYRLYNEFFTKD